ncbi:hypothetical protein BB559_004340 [Furculomyces boomerangus]|uniref:Uncharacterized protein n=1 Tax=Furculomyces boomerangus TaxID=61424 RepID=A0A2T9YFD3_9FUNG|nr:hypothetical protein BB559_004340 [Furculomyces boomerangus]
MPTNTDYANACYVMVYDSFCENQGIPSSNDRSNIPSLNDYLNIPSASYHPCPYNSDCSYTAFCFFLYFGYVPYSSYSVLYSFCDPFLCFGLHPYPSWYGHGFDS